MNLRFQIFMPSPRYKARMTGDSSLGTMRNPANSAARSRQKESNRLEPRPPTSLAPYTSICQHPRVMGTVQIGLDRVFDGAVLRGKKLGLLVHPASVGASLRHAVDLFLDHGADV